MRLRQRGKEFWFAIEEGNVPEDNKTEQPTDKKLRDAHREGQSAKSPDATATGVLLFCGLSLWLGADYFGDRLRRIFAVVWQFLPQREFDVLEPMSSILFEFFLLIFPVAMMGLLGAIVAIAAQGAATMSLKPVMPDISKLNPMAGVKRLFNLRSVIESGMLIFKAALLSVLLLSAIESQLPLLVDATRRPPEALISPLWEALLRVVFIALAGFAVFGFVDYGIQHFLFIRDQRMSKDEVMREYKSENGNPEVKATRKEFAHELLFGDPLNAVATSNMLVANPTHYAVAVAHVPGKIPTVVAKGVDDMAIRLRMHAESCGVPVVVNPPLARTLYSIPVGAGIPRSCFEIVALLLHTVDHLGKRITQARMNEAAQ